MFYATGWKAELPLSEVPSADYSPSTFHPEVYYPPQHPIEQTSQPLQAWQTEGPIQIMNGPVYVTTANPAQTYASRAPTHFDMSDSMSSTIPLMSDKEAQGTLESPFTSKGLLREQDPEGSAREAASDFNPQPDNLSFPLIQQSPRQDKGDDEDAKLSDEDVKPVLPPPLRNQPPRPQNAWILYRSDRLRAIAAGEPIPGLLAVLEEHSLVRAPDVSDHKAQQKGKDPPSSPEGSRYQLFKDAELSTPVAPSENPEDNTEDTSTKYRRALLQADISKVISMMWKRESRDVKSKFESMAEAKKLEHQQKYPNYKYQPIRKEERLKYQEQFKAEKERIKKDAIAAKAHQRKMAKATRQVKVSREKSLPLAIKAASEKRSRRTRRLVSQASHVLTIPLSPPRFDDHNQYRVPSAYPTSNDDEGGPPPIGPLGSLHDSSPLREIKQEPMEQPYAAYSMDYQHYAQPMAEYPGSMRATYYPMVEQQVYHLRPGGYVPVAQPGFMIHQNNVIPYTFEAIPLDVPLFSQAGERAIKEQPAIAVMEHSGYQPLGVSETELAEMWSMLEDDGGSSAVQPEFLDFATGNVQDGTVLDGDMGIETWGNLPTMAEEQEQTSIPLDRLSGFVASKIAMNWVDEQGQTSQTSTFDPVPITRYQKARQTVPVPSPLTLAGHQSVPITSSASVQPNHARAIRTQYTARDAPLCAQTPLSPIDGVYTPSRGTYPSVFAQSPYRQNQFFAKGLQGIEDSQSGSYYQQMYPSDFVGQPGANPYEYRLVTPRTASFHDSQFPPLSMSAPS
ncbi:hypothetical protein QFC22_001394 [Naganishia vaughanmartiniae]|uniref:Uncharacterized protein n=1 Tax=Naganishia vaughanmartiniae TaxID=1424756 RepID=A0ACC2XHT7_9TREE|nr:hypothetical protein QFC22_001394 [Naganishia vaughanmartiniae]